MSASAVLTERRRQLESHGEKLEFQPEDLRRDLLFLRKGSGFTTARLTTQQAARGALGGVQERPDVLAERFESAIDSLNDEDSELLRDIYRLSPDTQGMTSVAARRDHYGSKHGIRREAVADRDAAAIERLLTQLITGWYPKSPIPIRVPESHNGVVNHLVHVQTVVRDHRHLETHHHLRLFTLFDDAEYFTIASTNAQPPEVIGDTFRLRTVETENGFLRQFWHHHPMKRGQTYDLRFVVRNPDPDEPYWLHEESMAFHEPTRFARFEAVFIGDKPQHIWQFDRLTAVERPGVPTIDNRLDFNGTPSVKGQFRDLYGGLYSGIAWEW